MCKHIFNIIYIYIYIYIYYTSASGLGGIWETAHKESPRIVWKCVRRIVLMEAVCWHSIGLARHECQMKTETSGTRLLSRCTSTRSRPETVLDGYVKPEQAGFACGGGPHGRGKRGSLLDKATRTTDKQPHLRG